MPLFAGVVFGIGDGVFEDVYALGVVAVLEASPVLLFGAVPLMVWATEDGLTVNPDTGKLILPVDNPGNVPPVFVPPVAVPVATGFAADET